MNQADAIQGKTALHICAERDDADGCRILLAAGADASIRDKSDKCAHQLPKTPALIEQLGGNPLAVTLRRKAEMEMELRALKIQQLSAQRKVAARQALASTTPVAVPSSNNKIIRINPNKFPHGLMAPGSGNQTNQTPSQPVPPPVVVQTVTPVTPPPVVLHPPQFPQPQLQSYHYNRPKQQREQQPVEAVVVLPQDEHKIEPKESKKDFALELPQDAKPGKLGTSDEDDDDHSDADSDTGKRSRRRW